MSWFLLEAPSARQALPQMANLKKEICDQRGLRMLQTTSVFRDLRLHISIPKALRSPAVEKTSVLFNLEFPSLLDHRTLSLHLTLISILRNYCSRERTGKTALHQGKREM